MKNKICLKKFRSIAFAALLPLAFSCSTEDEKSEVPVTSARESAAAISEKGESKSVPQDSSETKVYEYAEQMLKFRGGEKAMLQFLGKNIRYPGAAIAAKVEGMAVLSFVVQTNGSLTDINVVKDLGYGTSEEAVRVVELMNGQEGWHSCTC